MGLQQLNWRSAKKITIFTGAGLSAAAGLRTFRGPGGLWNDAEIERLSHVETLHRDPLAVWRFFQERLGLVRAVRPTRSHEVIAGLERQLRAGQELTVVTTNIDGLHQAAGSTRVVEYHGSARRVRCLDYLCELEPFEDPGLPPDRLSYCPRCGQPLRVDVVLFGEMIPARAATDALHALAGCDLYVAIGSSGTVWPSAGFAMRVFQQGGHTVCLNLRLEDSQDPTYQEAWVGPADDLVPGLFGDGVDESHRVPGLWPVIPGGGE